MSKFPLNFSIALGRFRFYIWVKFLKLMQGDALLTTGRGWMASHVEIYIMNNGRAEFGYCEFSTGCKISVESQSILRIGDGVFFNRNCSVVAKKEISIGSNTLFGENVKIFDHDHVHIPTLEKNNFTSKPITIGAGCWFGSNVIILKGVSIGDNVTVGANAVISKDIPSNTVFTMNFTHQMRSK